ncbi:hypothetical protein BIW11_04939, partial [Tropilaelaps mercedesae]
AHIHLHMYI